MQLLILCNGHSFFLENLYQVLEKKLAEFTTILVHIPEVNKNIDYKEFTKMEFLKADIKKLPTLLKSFQKTSNSSKTIALIDLWDYIFDENFELVPEFLPAIMEQQCFSVIIAPPLSVIQKLQSVTEINQWFVKSKFAQKMKMIYELLLNSRGLSFTLIQTLPFIEHFLIFTGQPSLAPLQRFGLNFAPAQMNNDKSLFISSNDVINYIVNEIIFLKQGQLSLLSEKPLREAFSHPFLPSSGIQEFPLTKEKGKICISIPWSFFCKKNKEEQALKAEFLYHVGVLCQSMVV